MRRMTIEGSPRGRDRAMRSIRLDAFEADYKSGGTVLVRQRAYPNDMLHAGSLAINAPGVGLSVRFALLDPAAAETGRVVQCADFSHTVPEGTAIAQVVSVLHGSRWWPCLSRSSVSSASTWRFVSPHAPLVANVFRLELLRAGERGYTLGNARQTSRRE